MISSLGNKDSVPKDSNIDNIMNIHEDDGITIKESSFKETFFDQQ